MRLRYAWTDLPLYALAIALLIPVVFDLIRRVVASFVDPSSA